MSLDYTRLRNLSARELIRALKEDGFLLKQQKGSHARFVHPNGRRVTVSSHHPSDTFPPKTLKSMIEGQAHWTENDLKRLGCL